MRRLRGFSLVELILVILITGVLAGVVVIFVRPAVDSYVAQRARAELQAEAETSLGVMQRDIRRAVPNSLRGPGGACFELMPTIGGGRYRSAEGAAGDGSAALDTSQPTSRFDVLGPLLGQAAVGDWIVVGNQGVADAYALGVNRSVIKSIDPSATGSQRIEIETQQFPQGYAGGRFVVVPNNEQAVFFVCSLPNPSIVNGNGTGTLYRQKAYGFKAAYPVSCPAAGGEVLANQVSACSFEHSSTARTEYGLLTLNLALTRNGETVALRVSSRVNNQP
jgi:MSHA biogenesis protein MshO